MTASAEDKIVDWRSLEQFIQAIFMGLGMPATDAQTVASVLIWANLRGIDSHGVQLIPWYVRAAELGHMKVAPEISVEMETPAALLIDADSAFGSVVSAFAMKRVMQKAKSMGIGWAFIRNANHQGAIGYYPMMAAEKDMAGIMWSCGQTTTAPYGARFPGIANSPIAMAVPAKRNPPLILDMATSVAAASKLQLAREKKSPIPDTWALDAAGSATTDPWKAAVLLTISGPKGSGLSILLECLTSIMVGFPKLEPVLEGREPPFGLQSIAADPDLIRRHSQNSTLVAIDISRFTDITQYKEHIDRLIEGLKGLPKADGFEEIRMPGERGARTFEERTRNGIPIPAKTASNLRKVGERLGIQPCKGLEDS